MTLNSQGRIESIVVEESSGSTTLDHAAMEALRAAAPYEPFPPELRHLERMTFRLNFDYRQIVRPARPQG
jgi:protein TonB